MSMALKEPMSLEAFLDWGCCLTVFAVIAAKPLAAS